MYTVLLKQKVIKLLVKLKKKKKHETVFTRFKLQHWAICIPSKVALFIITCCQKAKGNLMFLLVFVSKISNCHQHFNEACKKVINKMYLQN